MSLLIGCYLAVTNFISLAFFIISIIWTNSIPFGANFQHEFEDSFAPRTSPDGLSSRAACQGRARQVEKNFKTPVPQR